MRKRKLHLIKQKNCWHDEYGVIEYDAYLFGFIYLYHWAYEQISDGNFIVELVERIKYRKTLGGQKKMKELKVVHFPDHKLPNLVVYDTETNINYILASRMTDAKLKLLTDAISDMVTEAVTMGGCRGEDSPVECYISTARSPIEGEIKECE